jgi:hypothetical protein
MRLPRVRFTVRGMMGAVAIVGWLLAAVMWAATMCRLSRDHRATASAHARLEAEIRSWVAEWEGCPGSAIRTQMMDELSRKADHSRRMKL